MRSRPRHVAAASVLLLVSLVAGGCAVPPDDLLGAGAVTGTPTRTPTRTPTGTPTGTPSCPAPEDARPADFGPCNPYDPNDMADRYAENHGYRREMELTPEQRAGAEDEAEALGAVLRTFAGKSATEAELRAAVAPVIGVQPNEVEVRGVFGRPLKNVLVGGGHGKVCVNGRIGDLDGVTAEVAGRTMDGTCLPGLGGH